MPTQRGGLLRGALLVNATVAAAIGLPLWGSYSGPLVHLGLELPYGYGDLVPWRAISLGGLFGGAMLAFAAALVALALSRDHQRLVMTAPIVLTGMFLLDFIGFAKVQAFGFAAAGHWMVVALVAAGALLFVAFVVEGGRQQRAAPDVLRGEEAATHAERTRLARDLHDSVKQQMYSVHAHLAAAEARWDVDAPGARDALAFARTGTRDAMREMSALLDRLQSGPIEGVGLVEALRRQCDALAFQTGATIDTEFGSLPTPDQMPAEVTTALFRIGQEALANVARHARPSRVTVFAGIDAQTGPRERFVLRVVDDGQGFDVDRIDEPSSMGLRNLRARAQEIGASLTVTSEPGRGTSVEVAVPLARRHAAAVAHASRWLAAFGLPTLVLAVWRVVWPEWATFLGPILMFGVVVTAGCVIWVVGARWAKSW